MRRKKLHDELSVDYTDMIYAKTVKEADARRKEFVRKWRLKYSLALAKRENNYLVVCDHSRGCVVTNRLIPSSAVSVVP